MPKIGSNCVIYALCDPRLRGVKAIKYIGKADNAEIRRSNHIKEAKALGNTHKQRWIRELLALGLEPKLRVLEKIVDCNGWQKQEIYWIAHYQGLGAKLTNIAPGGMGGATIRGRILSWRWKRNIAKGNLGHHHTEKAKAKMSEARKGKKVGPYSSEHRRHISESLRGRTFSNEHRKNLKRALNESEVKKAAMKKVGEARKGKKLPDWWRQRISEGLKRKKEQTENE